MRNASRMGTQSWDSGLRPRMTQWCADRLKPGHQTTGFECQRARAFALIHVHLYRLSLRGARKKFEGCFSSQADFLWVQANRIQLRFAAKKPYYPARIPFVVMVTRCAVQ